MKKLFCFIISICFFLVSADYAQEIIKKGNSLYLSNTLIVKLKKNILPQPQALSKAIPNFFVEKLIQMFPSQTTLNKGEEPLSRIYLLKYNSPEDPLELAHKISKQSDVEWAEPKYIQRVAFSPNDSLYVLHQQNNLQRIFADSAWNITKGDSNVIIGIVDTGVDWTHIDLAANVWYDQGNFVGYDFGGLNGTPDNDPSEDFSSKGSYHGTHVAGIACAVTNNQKGIASIGFNCSFIPIKASRGDIRDGNDYPYIYYGYEAIKYAADKKAKVINCSWGGYDYSHLGQEAIDYARSKGALVVAAAGNNGKLTNFYPASYNGVLSVGWLETNSDAISTAANYGRTVDVFAPGTYILSTWPNNSYNGQLSGSSMSSPLVAGLAGLVFAKFPNFNPLQVVEQIRVTSDNIEQSNNSTLKYLLGSGRVNAFRAVSETNTKSVRATNIKFIDEGNGNGLLESGETVSIEITFTNYLSDISNLNVTIESSDPAVSITNPDLIIGSLNTLEIVNNSSDMFKFSILQNGPYNHMVNFLVKYLANGYSDFQWITTRVNPTYDFHNNNNVELTVTSKGDLGFNDYPNNLEGLGLKYKGQDNVLFEGALIYGTSPNKLMDAARIDTAQSKDFQMISPVKVNYMGSSKDQEGIAVFNDDGAGANKLGIKTSMLTYSFTSALDSNFIILRNKFENTTGANINNLFVGYYFDFDITSNDYTDDMVDYDDTDNFGYAYDLDGLPQKIFIGSALISSNKHGFYAINQDSTTGNVTPNGTNGFTDAEKWFSISNGIKKKKAGPADISCVISGGSFNILPGQTLDVAFAIACGSTLENVRASIRESRDKWIGIVTGINQNDDELPKEFLLYQNYPNPFNPTTIIRWQIAVSSYVTLRVYDMLGREVATLVDEFKPAGSYNSQFSILPGGRQVQNYHLSSGVYFYHLQAGNYSSTKKMILIK